MKYIDGVRGLCALPSPPSRGAWIEIRNGATNAACYGSPPSRGAWIEMGDQKEFDKIWDVAPLAGGVD